MPAYEYDCMSCAKRYTKYRSIADSDPGYSCDDCNKQLVRVYANFGIQFKGNGFYSTDHRK